jgi:hypothetical protein
VASTFSCGTGTVLSPSVQAFYNAPKNAFNRSMGADTSYTMSFKTGPSADGVLQELDFVEWSGAPNIKDVSLAAESCNFTASAIGRRQGSRVNMKFTVGGSPKKVSFFGSSFYPLLQPNTVYFINLRNKHPLTGAETCPSGCGFNFKFFATVPF